MPTGEPDMTQVSKTKHSQWTVTLLQSMSKVRHRDSMQAWGWGSGQQSALHNLRAYYFVAPPVCFCFPTLLPASDATAGQHGQCDCAWAPCSPSLAQISAFKGCGRTQEGLFDRKSLRPYCTQHCTPTGEVDVHITIASHAVRRMYTQARPLYFKPMSANLPITSFQ